MRFLWYTLLALVSLGFVGLIGSVGAVVFAISYYGRDLPDHRQLKNYEPPIVTRLYAGDGRLMEEYATETRVFVPIEAIPAVVKNAFISTEDKKFYSHHGLDYEAIARAIVQNLRNLGSGRRLIGASTITQQVAKNMLLEDTSVKLGRKIREAILATRMERALTKDQLLEIYLNEIYLGGGAYGVAAAALRYFNKSLDELDIQEAAFLAELPKAPNNYNPDYHPEAALERRNWVISRMAEDDYITPEQAEAAKASPLKIVEGREDVVASPYFSEEVRRELKEKFGEKGLYGGGYAVRTSMDPRLQAIAVRALREGLMDYDMRKGWRGPLGKIARPADWLDELRAFAPPENMLSTWRLAAVRSVDAKSAAIGLADGGEGKLLFDDTKWAITSPTSFTQILHPNEIVMVERKPDAKEGIYLLRQIPAVQGALIAMDPHTGRVLAMQGGWKYESSEFNRATQAWRQPGSAFKPFVYLAALDNGFTPATLIMDAPFVIEQRPGVEWRPVNYTGEYYGPTPLRVGLEKSRNLMTVRLANYVGMDTVVDYAKRFGVVLNLEPWLSGALGSGETTLLRLTNGYAQFVNGGKRIAPTFIDRIQDRRGKTIFSDDTRPCEGCGPLVPWENQSVPDVPDTREQIADPRTSYQIVSMLEGVVQRGTGVRIKSLNRPLAGKTGTTNHSKDTWFIGFSPDLAVGVFVGYDEPKALGKRETGASVAVPVFREFMKEALEGTPPIPFRIPPGIRQVRVNADDGTRAKPGDQNVIWESFLIGTEPTDEVSILDGKEIMPLSAAGTGGVSTQGTGGATSITGTGGLY